MADIRRQGPSQTRPSRALVYVAETNTGVLLAYVLHWNSNLHSSDVPYNAVLQLWAIDRFSTALVRSP